MRPRVLFVGGSLILLLMLGAWKLDRASSTVTVQDGTNTLPPAVASLCPWREPESDLKNVFPEATRYAPETRILSGERLELAKRLGRLPTADEHSLHLYRVFQETTPVGLVLTRRVRGDYGAIELVLLLNMDHSVRDWKIQRIREPDAIVRALSDPAFQQSFQGKTAESPWRLGEDVPDVIKEARAPASAVLEGARAMLVLAAVADKSALPAAARHH